MLQTRVKSAIHDITEAFLTSHAFKRARPPNLGGKQWRHKDKSSWLWRHYDTSRVWRKEPPLKTPWRHKDDMIKLRHHNNKSSGLWRHYDERNRRWKRSDVTRAWRHGPRRFAGDVTAADVSSHWMAAAPASARGSGRRGDRHVGRTWPSTAAAAERGCPRSPPSHCRRFRFPPPWGPQQIGQERRDRAENETERLKRSMRTHSMKHVP